MNREKEDQLPLMQVGFIDSICMPIYEVITSTFDFVYYKIYRISEKIICIMI